MNTQLAKESLEFLSKDLPQKISRLIDLELSRLKFCDYKLAPDFSDFVRQLSNFNRNPNFYFKLNNNNIRLVYETLDGIVQYVDMPDIFFDDYELFLQQDRQDIETNNTIEILKYKEFKNKNSQANDDEYQTYLKLKSKYEGTK